MTEREYLAAVSAYTPFGPARIKLLLRYFKTASRIWKADARKLHKIGLGGQKVEQFIKHRNEFNPTAYFNRLNKLSIKFAVLNDKDYPKNLRGISDAPPVLYYKGKLSLNDDSAIAVIGSRKMTAYGREITEKLAGELASFGVTIISGLARGVDTAAHKAALLGGGRTVAVLGCGLDGVYPPENANLANEIVKNGGALISEYPLGHPALPINFANRNRIISGLSKGVLVIEGAEKSGTLLTASHAADQGRDVFAVPGQITSPLSAAPLGLIKNGAKMVTTSADILEELDLEMKVDKDAVDKIMPGSPEEEKILGFLENEALHLDELARISSLDVSEVSARLTVMELKGMVKSLGGGVYKKN